MFGYIYKTTNLINGKIYIGQHHGDFNIHYHGSGNLIRNAVKKYGVGNFETQLIEECFNDSELNDREIFWINYFDSRNLDIGYNLHKGGISSPVYGKTSHRKGKKLSAETRKRMSEADTGRKKTESHRLHIKQALMGHKIPDDVKKKISESVKKNSPCRGSIWIKNPKTGESLKLKPEDAEKYFDSGWVEGRFLKKNNKINTVNE